MQSDDMDRPCLLILEDDEFVANMVSRIAKNAGFTSVLCSEEVPTDEELALADLVVTDISLPHVAGVTHMEKLAGAKTKKSVILISGMDAGTLSSTAALLGLLKVDIIASLSKPFNKSELQQLMSDFIASH